MTLIRRVQRYGKPAFPIMLIEKYLGPVWLQPVCQDTAVLHIYKSSTPGFFRLVTSVFAVPLHHFGSLSVALLDILVKGQLQRMIRVKVVERFL